MAFDIEIIKSVYNKMGERIGDTRKLHGRQIKLNKKKFSFLNENKNKNTLNFNFILKSFKFFSFLSFFVFLIPNLFSLKYFVNF